MEVMRFITSKPSAAEAGLVCLLIHGNFCTRTKVEETENSFRVYARVDRFGQHEIRGFIRGYEYRETEPR